MEKRSFTVTFSKMPDNSINKIEFVDTILDAEKLAYCIVLALSNLCLVHNVHIGGYPIKRKHFSSPLIYDFLEKDILQTYLKAKKLYKS